MGASIATLLKAYGKTELLTAQEEIELGHRVQEMLRSNDKDSGIVSRGKVARERLIKANLRLVINIAKKYKRQHFDLQDLINEGVLGLNKAVLKFDPSKGYRFSTYAYWWIRQAISRYTPKEYAIRVPFYLMEIRCQARDAEIRLTENLGRNPTIDELASEIDRDPDTLKRAMGLPSCHLSLDVIPLNAEDSFATIVPATPSAREQWQNSDVKLAISELSPAHKTVVMLRYFEDKSIASIAEIMGISYQTVKTLEVESLDMLRKKLN